VARRLALWRVDQTDRLGRAEQASGNPGLAQEALEADLGRCGPAIRALGKRFVEVGLCRLEADQELRPAVRVGDGEGRLQSNAKLGQADAEPIRRSGKVVLLPAKEFGEQPLDVKEALLIGVQKLLEALLPGPCVPV
jgi:hypothetical protein